MKLKFNCFIFFTCFYIASTASLVGDETRNIKVYEIQGGIVQMKNENGAVINLSCEGSCVALKKSKIIIDHTELSLLGGKNPGAVACRDVFKSKVVMLRGENGEQTFCLFSDGSLLSTKSIIIK